jgi:hypothetical protein
MKTLIIVFSEESIAEAQQHIRSMFTLVSTPFLNIYEMYVKPEETKTAVNAIEYIFAGLEFNIYSLN